MKIMKIKNNLTVILEDGTMFSNTNCTEEMYQAVLNAESEAIVKDILVPGYSKIEREVQMKKYFMDSVENSEYMTVTGSSIYIKSISELSLPEDLAIAILEAEENDDVELLSTYLNFWTLCSLNPGSRARTNLFWFLNRYGMTISSSGLFIAYRNVILKSESSEFDSSWVKFITDSFSYIRFKRKQSPKKYYLGLDEDGEKVCGTDESKIHEVKGNLFEMYESLSDEKSTSAPVYTDGRTKTFTIRIGVPVSMPRSECDPNQDNTCSDGLHVAGKSWLQSNYFGDTGLRVLVNPADVVAVPPKDNYGKMRTCAYYPVAVVDFDENGRIIDEGIENGFEDNFLDMITYTGEVNAEDPDKYEIEIPTVPELSRQKILSRLEDIKESLRIKNQEIE